MPRRNLTRDLKAATTPDPSSLRRGWITDPLCRWAPWLGRLVCGPR